jgi:anti-sigma regulatory factor (Ser/Thr protein kinase)
MTMILDQSLAFAIEDASQVGEVRRAAVSMANAQGFDEPNRGRVAIVVTEAATNLLKHASGGELILRRLDDDQTGGIEILSLDKGPGIADLARCRIDGYSTAGSPGHGLGAMARLSESFEIQSLPGVGTVMLARLWSVPAHRPHPRGRFEIGLVTTPTPGEEVCGDGWAVGVNAGRDVIMMVDGLGHGTFAAEAAREAAEVFRKHIALGAAGLIRTAHESLRSTRGAAMAVAEIDTEAREIRFAGAGNISASIIRPGEGRSSSMVSLNGTVGHSLRKVQEFTYPWDDGALLVMHSDGLSSHWQIDRYAGLSAAEPGLIAGVLYRDFKRGRDDATVLVARERSGTAS